MASTRELRRHIRSVRSTRQITKAMEMVAGSKLRRSTDAALAARPYALRISEAVRDALITPDELAAHPLLTVREVKKTVLVVISSDRGLAGPYNTNIVKEAIDFIRTEQAAGREVVCITFGRKAEQALNNHGVTIVQSYAHALTHPVAADVLPLARSLAEMYTRAECDRVAVLGTHFLSAMRQVSSITSFLPLSIEAFKKETSTDTSYEKKEENAEKRREHLFLHEPDPENILDMLIPRYLETVLYQYLQESVASEHAARRIAMHNATDNASEILDHLQLTYNTVRQSSITQEIAEITSGTVALETN